LSTSCGTNRPVSQSVMRGESEVISVALLLEVSHMTLYGMI
jgi:hypothetical protein